jgi:purine-nucleoside phosphorylase, family 1 (deoD)
MSIPTPHIEATDASLIAKTVLMPGDPLRAKYVADTFLDNVVAFNNVRGMLGYTGTYKGRRISVMGSGMGMPSIGIYSYELFKFYGVEQIVRIGSAGAYKAEIDLYQVVVVESAYSESTFALTQAGELQNILYANADLTEQLKGIASELSIPVRVGRTHSSDVFYRENYLGYEYIRDEFGCDCVEMESFALFHNASQLGKKAACLLTISDNLVTHELTSSEERQSAFSEMMKIALELAE